MYVSVILALTFAFRCRFAFLCAGGMSNSNEHNILDGWMDGLERENQYTGTKNDRAAVYPGVAVCIRLLCAVHMSEFSIKL